MKRKFDALDYVIFVLILLISIFIGLYFGLNLNEKLSKLVCKLFGRKKLNKVGSKDAQQQEEEKDGIEISELKADPDVAEQDDQTAKDKTQTMNYFTANSSMGSFPIAMSLLATFFSSSSLLGFPAEVYENGIQYLVVVFGVSLVPLLGAFLTGPFFYNLKVVSVFEYLKMRFNHEAARLLGVTLYLIRTFIAMGIVIYGPATALNSLTDIPTEWSICIIGVIATFYTTIGGIKAVIWTDAFQTIIMFSGMIAAIIKGVYDVGGFNNLLDINRQGGRLNMFNFDPDPLIRQSFWSLVIGSFFAWTMSYAIDQQMVQRFSAAKSKRTAQKALLLNIPGIILLISICCFTGLVLYANYATCDPVKDTVNTGLKNYNQLLPYFVLDKFNNIPCIPGLFLSSIFCASLSSVSSALNSMSACIWRDYLMHLRFFKSYDDKKASKLTKIIVLIIGLVCMSFSFLISQLGSNLIQISNTINGALQAPIIGIFILSSMFPFANIYGLFAGAISGFAITCWISIGSFIVKPQYPRLPVSVESCIALINPATSSAAPEFFDVIRNGPASNLSGFNRIYSLSYMWLSPLGVLTTVLVGCLVSVISYQILKRKYPDRSKTDIDDSLILYRYVRNSWRNRDSSKPIESSTGPVV